jgi:hypothetical protein
MNGVMDAGSARLVVLERRDGVSLRADRGVRCMSASRRASFGREKTKSIATAGGP